MHIELDPETIAAIEQAGIDDIEKFINLAAQERLLIDAMPDIELSPMDFDLPDIEFNLPDIELPPLAWP